MNATTTDISTKKIRVGLIGVGNWAKHGHVRVLQLLPQYEVVAAYSRTRASAEAAASTYGIKYVVDSIEELARHPEVDLVVVLTTPPQHEEGVRAAIAAGKDVYCEWPLTTSTAEAEQFLELARKAKVRHFVGLQRRVAPFNLFVRDLLSSGYVGKLRSVRIHVSMNYFQATRGNALRWTIPPENFSNVVAIYAGHFLDMLFTATGRPEAIAAKMVNQFEKVTIAETGEVFETTTPDQLVLAGTFAGGAVLSVHIEGGKRNGSGVQIDITGEEGDIRITNKSAFGDVGDDYLIEGVKGDNLPFETLKVPAKYDRVPESGLPSAVLELAALYEAFARGGPESEPLLPTFGDAIWLHKFLDALSESSDGGKTVQIDNSIN
jgi:predicted dehydrogenase